MKKTFKLLSATLAMTLMGGVLSSCGTKTSSDSEVITIWSVDSHSKAVYDKLINEFNETTGKKDGIRIDYQIKPNDSMNQSVQLALQSGDAPDMFNGGSLDQLVEMNYIAAIDDLPGGTELIEKNKNSLRKGVNIGSDGKVYSLPYYATTRGLLYNKDMFKAAGIVDENGEALPPETLEELREDAKKLTNADKQQYGIILPMKWKSWFMGDVAALMQNSVGNVGYDYATGKYDYSAYVPIMECYLGIKTDNSMYPAPESLDNDSARAYFAEGNIGMKFGFSFDVGVLNDQFPAKIDWGVAPLPVINKDNKYLQKMTQTNTYFINATATKDEAHAKKVAEVLEFFLSDDFMSAIYQAGVALPTNTEIIKNTKLENPPKGWKEFADMVAISSFPGVEAVLNFEGRTTIKDRFINDVWSGEMTPQEAVDLYTKDVDEASKSYFELHTDEKPEDYVDSSWDIKR